MKVAIILKAPSFSESVLEEKVIYADAAYAFKNQVGKKQIVAVVGDFDSLGKAPEGENVVKLNEEKNFTDGERAVRLAKEMGFDEVVIYGAFGGKIEHVLGNVALLKIAQELGLKASIKNGQNVVELISGKACLKVKKDSLFSLIPYGGNCVFNSSEGLYYSLNGLTLTPSDTRGISNVAKSDKITLEIQSGFALAFYVQ